MHRVPKDKQNPNHLLEAFQQRQCQCNKEPQSPAGGISTVNVNATKNPITCERHFSMRQGQCISGSDPRTQETQTIAISQTSQNSKQKNTKHTIPQYKLHPKQKSTMQFSLSQIILLFASVPLSLGAALSKGKLRTTTLGGTTTVLPAYTYTVHPTTYSTPARTFTDSTGGIAGSQPAQTYTVAATTRTLPATTLKFQPTTTAYYDYQNKGRPDNVDPRVWLDVSQRDPKKGLGH